MMPVRLKPAALRSRVKLSTTEPLRYLVCSKCSHYALQKSNNKGANQIAQMGRLVCAFLVAMQQIRFSHIWGPYDHTVMWRGNCILLNYITMEVITYNN